MQSLCSLPSSAGLNVSELCISRGHMHILVTTLVVHLCDMAEKQNKNTRQHLPPPPPPSTPATAFAICRRFHYYFYFQPQSCRRGKCLAREKQRRSGEGCTLCGLRFSLQVPEYIHKCVRYMPGSSILILHFWHATPSSCNMRHVAVAGECVAVASCELPALFAINANHN